MCIRDSLCPEGERAGLSCLGVDDHRTMSAILPSFAFQLVTTRHQLKWAAGVGGDPVGDGLSPTEMEPDQPVTDRNQLDRAHDQLVTDPYHFQLVTICNQLTRAMRQFSLWLVALALLVACQPGAPTKEAAPREIHTADYDLIIPAEQKALLILFPCFSCDAADLSLIHISEPTRPY